MPIAKATRRICGKTRRVGVKVHRRVDQKRQERRQQKRERERRETDRAEHRGDRPTTGEGNLGSAPVDRGEREANQPKHEHAGEQNRPKNGERFPEVRARLSRL